MQKEIWKDINNYKGLYQISNKGNVKSRSSWKNGGLLSPGNTRQGYKQVGLCRNGKVKRVYIHRLVAEAFIPNPNKLPDINHKDGNPSNNALHNLEWCTEKENTEHAINSGLMTFPSGEKSRATKREINQLDKNGNFINHFFSIAEAVKQNSFHKNVKAQISSCCKGRQRTAHGYKWEYSDK